MKTFEEVLLDVELESEANRTLHKQRRNRKKISTGELLFKLSFLLWLLTIIAVLLVYASKENFNGNGQEKMSENSNLGFEEVLLDEPMDNTTKEVLSNQNGHIPGDDVPATEYASLEAYIADGGVVRETKQAQFTVTHYCGCVDCCGKWSGGSEIEAVGAAGTKLTPYYSVAVDTSIIPLGTILYDMEGNEYKAEDTGSAIDDYRIDIFIGDHEEALKLGIKHNVTFYWEE